MPRKLTGIRRWKGAWQAYVKVHGQTFSKSFPLNTPLETLRAWREEQRRRFGLDIELRSVADNTRLPRSMDGWCYVYFVRCGAAVKIGRAVDVNVRMRELQTAQAGDLVLLASVAAHAALEPALHKRFSHLRTRAKGEWFRLEPDLIAFIHAIKDGANPIALLFEDPRVVLGWYLRPPPPPKDEAAQCLEH